MAIQLFAHILWIHIDSKRRKCYIAIVYILARVFWQIKLVTDVLVKPGDMVTMVWSPRPVLSLEFDKKTKSDSESYTLLTSAGLHVLGGGWAERGAVFQQSVQTWVVHSGGGPRPDRRGGPGGTQASHGALRPRGEQWIHGAHPAYPGHYAHRHLLLLHHRILLSEGGLHCS